MIGEVPMPELENELLKSREPYFKQAGLKELVHLCGDERAAEDLYIHLFGGVANTTYTTNVLQETSEEGSVTTPLDESVPTTVIELSGIDIKAGVHSDNHAELGNTIDTNETEGKIGCGYLELRQAISLGIGERVEEIVKILSQADPVLYSSEDNRDRAREYCYAHGRLSKRNIFPAGRKIALAALKAGAPSNIVKGDHVGKQGIINKRRNTTLASTEAFHNGLPTYDHDSWAAIDTYREIKGNYGFVESDYEIANDVDAVGTMLALGVEEIAVRR